MDDFRIRYEKRSMDDRGEMLEIVAGQKFMTLAMCRDREPYLVSVNYAFDQAAGCFYFHCAKQGKKIDYLEANPVVWGQVLEDRGYLPGQCDHDYRTVHFKGEAEFVQDPEEKKRALEMMIEKLESDPAPVKEAHITESCLAKVCIVKIRVLGMSGKRRRTS